MSSTKLLQRRTNVPGQVPGITDIDLGEIAINTHEGKMYVKRNRLGQVDIVQVGQDAVENVFYVSKSGEYGNTGTSLGDSFKTLDSAVQRVTALKTFAFNETKCARDLGYIFDGLYLDIAFGTNYNAVTSGLAYQRAGSLKVTTQQLTPTRVSFNQARGAIASVDEVKASTGIGGALYRNNLHWSEIIDILINGSLSTEKAADTIVYPEPVILPSADANDAAIILQNNREWLKDELTSFIATNYPDLTYDKVRCYRDTGFLIDAIITDLMTGSNYNAVTAGLAYYRGNATAVLTDQKSQTIDAMVYLRDLINDLAISTATKASVTASIKEIVDIVTNSESAANTVVYPASPAAITAEIDAGLQLQNNKTLLIDNTIAYIANNFAVQDYDETKCRRDIGHIVDAITVDLMLGTNYNTVTAGLAYQRANAAFVLSDQKEFTIGAINTLRDGINALAINAATKLSITDSIAEIVDIINNSLTGVAKTLVFPNSPTTTTNKKSAGDQILNNKTLIIDSVISYISENFSSITFDRVKCSRDVGYIIEALTNDLLFGTNYNTVTAGNAYQRANAAFVLSDQQVGTVATIRQVGVLISALAVDATTKTTITDLIEVIIDIIEGGTSAAPVIVFPASPASSNNEEYAALQIQNNRTLIVNDLISYINTNYPSLDYDEDKCARDTGYILDGLTYDILYDGNFASRINTFAYFVGAVSQLGGAGEVAATIDAYEQLQTILTSVLAETYAGQDITSEEQQGLLQVTTRVTDLLQITIDAITAGNYDDVPALEGPDTTGIEEPIILDYATIVAAKSTIQAGAIAYADLYGPVQYDRDLCRRDLGYILDGLRHDILYGGNFGAHTSARAYFVGTVSQLGGAGEVAATIGAYTHLQTVLASVVQETFAGQNTTAGTATVTEANTLTSLIQIIIDVITAGDLDDLAARVLPDFTGVSATKTTDYATINAALSDLQNDVITYADLYGPVTYDRVKCRRDLGYIIDALTHDIVYSGNVGAVTCARAYFVGAVSQLGAGEIAATLGAYEYLTTSVKQVVQETYSGQNTSAGTATVTEANQLEALIQIIIDVITAGDLDDLAATVLPDFTGIGTTTTNDYNTILAGKTTLQDQTVAYVDLNGPVSYDRVRCRRDIGFIVDGLTFDILYGGTHGITLNTRAYFVGAASQLGAGETAATVATYNHLKVIVDELVRNALSSNLVDGADETGNSSNYATSTEGNQLIALLTILTDALSAGNLDSLPAIVTPLLSSRGVSAELRDAIAAVQKIQTFLILQSVNAAKNTGDTTIFLKSGDYIVNNPIKLPPKTAIVGDNLRTTTVRPRSVDSDIFYMDNGCFIKDITFRDHQNLAACVAFDPRVDSPGAGPFIVQSPYVQNCTSITNDGIGMKIDGSKASGLRSMVSDAFTQYNAAGIGTYLLNRGYAQLVSIFTISTQTSILAETGGQCSITNSNSSFGDYGLIARGSSPVLYNGQLDSARILYDDVLRIRNVINRDSADYITGGVGLSKLPNYGDAMLFDSENYFYTVLGVDSLGGGLVDITFEPPLNSNKKKDQTISFKQRSVITSSSHTFEYVGAGTNTFTAIPQNGGIPKREREVVYDSETNEGLVVFTSTDQLGDFRIGAELTIKRQEGRIVGETFERSLYAILTPYILALEG